MLLIEIKNGSISIEPLNQKDILELSFQDIKNKE